MAFLITFLLLSFHGGEYGDCDRLAFAVSAVASESASQSFEAQINVARGVRDNAWCGDPNYLSGYRIALLNPDANNHHARAYFRPYSFPQEYQDRWLAAALIAYTEEPRIPIRHFDRAGSTAWWWDSPKACPNGWVEIDQTRFC